MEQVPDSPGALPVTSPQKVLFPESDITKADLVEYYRRVAAWMLPHIRERPLMTQHFPRGIGAPGFRQQHIPEHYPPWVSRITVPKEDGVVTHVLCNDPSTLVYLATQNCITPHGWLSRADRPEHPDRLVFDLDPPEGIFEPVAHGAVALRDLLKELGLVSYVMTSGSKGLHVVVPLDRAVEFEDTRAFARAVAEELVRRYPDSFTTAIRKDEREGRVFLDVLRNAYGQTSVPPYAVRARARAPVATPLHWCEVGRKELDPQRYTMKNLFRRLGQLNEDPWGDLREHAQSIVEPRRRLAGIDKAVPASSQRPA